MHKYVFETRMEVRDYECDIEGIVNNANYLHYTEHTRHLFLKECGLSFAEMHQKGIDAVVARMKLQFKVPLRCDDEFISRLWLEKQGIKYIFHQDHAGLPGQRQPQRQRGIQPSVSPIHRCPRMTMPDEIYYTIALTRMTGFNAAMALQLYQALGSGQAVYEHRNDIGDVIPDTTPRLCESMKHWDDALKRAAAEMEFITKNNIRALAINDIDYPQRLAECPDAPILLYYKGTADLNQRYVLNMVGTRRCTTYGQDLIRHFISDLRQLCPQVLVVSGLAYGIDICAHRNALQQGY